MSLASRYFSRLCRRRRHLNITSSRTRSCLQRIGCHHMVTFTAAQLNDYTSIASSFTTHCRLSLEPLPFLHHPTTTINRPHLTAHSSPCTYLRPPVLATSLPQRLQAEAAPRTCRLFPTNRTSATSWRSRASPDSGWNADRWCLVAACQLLRRSSIINRFSRFDHPV